MALIDDVAEYLEDNAIGTVGTDLFKGTMPLEPSACVGITRTGGSNSSQEQTTRRASFQIVVRSGKTGATGASEADLTAAYDLAESIRSLMHADQGTLSTQFIMDSSTTVLTTQAIQEPFNLGKDDSERYRIAANYDMLIVNS